MIPRDIENDLVIRAKSGEQVAFEVLVKKYRRRMLRQILGIVRNLADAEEVLQEVLILAFRGLPAFRGDAGFYTWFFRIGLNRAKTHQIVKGKRSAVSVQLSQEAYAIEEMLAVSEICSPHTALENKESIEALDQCLTNMPAKLRIALVLFEIEGHSYGEIGEIEKIPVGTVRSRIARARQFLNDQLNPGRLRVPSDSAIGDATADDRISRVREFEFALCQPR